VTTTDRSTRNLIALASAAVVAIYGAGYLRTRSAAQKFAGDSERRPGAAAAPQLPVSADTPAVLHDVPAAQPTTHTTKAILTVAAAAASTPTPSTIPPVVEPPKAVEVRPMDSTPVIVVPSSPAPPVAPAPAAQPIDSAAHPADSVRAKLKDGTYTGYGTSRHGDIEAAVEIKDGRIVSASITQCLTRYSCSRIAAIIPQVVARQSAEVDYVTGATQSSDAFYYAVLEALSKAK
jgi:uncharacterized protein with FMN-binding domain